MGRKKLVIIKDDEGKLIKKQCSKCGEIKDTSEFYKDKTRKDGLRNLCKNCMSNNCKKNYDKKKDEYSKRSKEYYEKNREKALEYQKTYYKDNKEKVDEYKKQWYKDSTNKTIEEIYYNFTKSNYPNYGIQYGIIYGVHNKITDRWYIGQTIRSFKERYNDDFFKYKLIDKMNEEKRMFIENDLIKYGKESFEIIEVLDVAFSPMELDEKEVYYIDYYEAYNKGYNSNKGFINGRQTLYNAWIKENKNKGDVK